MKWRVSDQDDFGIARNGVDYIVDRRADADVIVIQLPKIRPRHSQRIDEHDVVSGFAQYRRRLHRPQIREVRVIDEIPRDAEGRKSDGDAVHEPYGVYTDRLGLPG